MLPFLPALLLLLLQGPASIERTARTGQLPGALEALHRQATSSPDRGCVADDVVFASLIACGSDRHVSLARARDRLDHTATAAPQPTDERVELPEVELAILSAQVGEHDSATAPYRHGEPPYRSEPRTGS